MNSNELSFDARLKLAFAHDTPLDVRKKLDSDKNPLIRKVSLHYKDDVVLIEDTRGFGWRLHHKDGRVIMSTPFHPSRYDK